MKLPGTVGLDSIRNLEKQGKVSDKEHPTAHTSAIISTDPTSFESQLYFRPFKSKSEARLELLC